MEKAGEAAVRFVRLAKPVPRKVAFDRRGRTIVDGKPFFPLGMFSAKVDKEMLDIYAEGPFNCLMPYVRPGKAEFDLCHEKGLRVIFFLNGGWETKIKAGAGSRTGLRRSRIIRQCVRGGMMGSPICLP